MTALDLAMISVSVVWVFLVYKIIRDTDPKQYNEVF